ncbi:hypothetical protein LSCM1_03891 [Leishmania martiniquensis]|uniref:Arf3-interacting protein 1 N-terminal domain-containing protein n=1 Tax=Leishmania martiniquensis TaxID=1580590 RepID=A0A836KH22_9TRYP|nr:hypothetical protein LSCM1_03891 [Leishmania martiniquensis]
MRKSYAAAVAATPLATSLIVAEFDIDTGACLRACYPRPPAPPSRAPSSSSIESVAPPGIAGHTEYFANVMLPDGAEKVSVTRTVFVVNRPQLPSYLRFPVYRFARAATSAGCSNTQVVWERSPAVDTALYVHEVLLINAATEEMSLRYKDAEIEAPCLVPMENISSLSSMPTEVVRFSKQLEAMVKNDGGLVTSHSASFAAGADTCMPDPAAIGTGGAGGRSGASLGSVPTSASGGGGGSTSGGNSSGDYAFVVVDYTSAAAVRQEGYLMKVAHFERLLKRLTTRLQREKTTDTAAPGASRTDTSGNASAAAAYERIRTPLANEGSLGTVDSTPSRAPLSSSVTATFDFAANAAGGPYKEDVYGGCRAALGDGAKPSSPSLRVAGGGGGADTPITPNAAEPSGHLMLPGINPASSGGDGDADSAVRGHPVNARPRPAIVTEATQKGDEGASTEGPGAVLFGLCAVVSKLDSTARRGGITKSVAVLGPSLVWLEPFFPVLVAAAQYCCDVNGTDESALRELHRILKRCYDAVNNAAGAVASGRAKVDQLTAEISKLCTVGSGQQAYVYYSDAPFGDTIKAKIPLSPEPNDIVFTRYSLECLIEALGPSSLQLLLGVLTEKKILILSRKGEAADVCEAALSLGIIGNLLDPNFMAQKVFPYVSVSSVDYFMQVPGYIVGTLNPIFDNVQPWGWDLLCDLDNKSVVTAAERLQRRGTGLASSVGGNWSAATAGLANAVGVGGGSDAETLRSFPVPLQKLYKELMSTIYHLRALRIGAGERNRRLRLIVEDFLYTMVLVGHAAGGNTPVPNALYSTFAHRSIVALRSEMMLTSTMDNVRSHILHRNETPALLLHCVALRHCAGSETPVHRTLQALLALLNTAYDVKLFLRRMPLAVGGLNAVGMQLTSPSAEARAAAAELLARVELVPEGKAAIASMNNFFLMVYENSVAGVSR